MEDSINKIAGRVEKALKNIGAESKECPLCKKAFTDYSEGCRGYSWDITYFPSTIPGESGSWHFTLSHHRKEIWYTQNTGTITDILLNALESLNRGEWKKHHTS